MPKTELTRPLSRRTTSISGELLFAILLVFMVPHIALGQSPVRVNEIMYAPISPEPEWIELYNPGVVDISTQNWKIKVKTKTVLLGTSLIPAGGYRVFTRDSTTLRSAHPNYPFSIVQDTLPTLANSGDVVSIIDASGKTVDSLTYSPSWGGKSGKSLERIFISGSSTDPANWGTSKDDSGSTPGVRNSITPPDHDLAVGTDSGSFSGDTISILVKLRNRGTQNASSAKLYLLRSAGEDSMLYTPIFIDSINLPAILAFDSLVTTFREPNQPYTSLTYEVRVVLDSDEVARNDTATLRFSSGLAPQSVVINEVMYAPKGIEPEWVELYNRTPDSLDLSAAILRNASQAGGLIPANTRIAPSEYLVVTKSDSLLRVTRPKQTASIHIVQMALPDLPNAGDAVSFIDARNNRVDSVVFRPSWGGGSGASLERIDFDQPSFDSTNLGNCIDSSGASPGMPNSIRRRETDIALISVSDSLSSDGSLTLILHLKNQGKTRIDTCSVTVTTLDSNSTQSIASSLITPELATLGLDTERISCSPLQYGRSHYRITIKAPRDSIFTNDTLTFTDTISVPASGLKVNEVMFAPITSSCQWIELYNFTHLPIQTAGLLLRVSSDTAKHILSIPASVIPSSSFAIIAADSNFYYAFPSLVNKTTIIQLSRATLELSTSAGSLTILNPDSTLIEGIIYSLNWLAGTGGGTSLERISRSRSVADSTNWLPSVAQAGATPLAENSVSNLNPSSLLIPVLSITPNPFSPDGDGVDDVTAIQYTTGSTLEVTTRIRIFDMRSRTVRTLVDGTRTYLQGQASFDGRSDSGNTLPIGLYTLFIECTDDAGITRSARTGVVIAKRVH